MMLKIHELDTYYGDIQVHHKVSLNVKRGETVALIGTNGSGKTTLLKTISCLIRPTNGTIEYLGKSINNLKPEQVVRLGIAHVPEGRNVFPDHTVDTNMEMGAYIRKDKDGVQKDKEMYYEMFPPLGRMRGKQAGLLSGGEQQMLALCRCLMSRPELILMDEPSMGLAPLLVDEIFEIIDSMHKDQRTILIVEQNIERALGVSDRAYVISTGEIVKEGESRELLASGNIADMYLGITK